jgi:ParB family chromosome partitioning protein
MTQLPDVSSSPSSSLGIIKDIPISSVKVSQHLRCNIGDLSELSASIKRIGLLHPILVRSNAGDFEIVAGNRRYLSCKSLGWKRITCHIAELDDKEAYEISMIENVQRKTLNPIEEAKAFKAYVYDYGWGGISDLALKLGKSVSYVSKHLKLLDLPSDVLRSVSMNTIHPTIAEELLFIKDKTKQSELAALIAERRLSLRKTRRILKEIDHGKNMDYNSYHMSESSERIDRFKRAFNKIIITLRIAMNNIGDITNGFEHDWVVYEILMQHKNLLHTQIDIMIKEKKKVTDLSRYIYH